MTDHRSANSRAARYILFVLITIGCGAVTMRGTPQSGQPAAAEGALLVRGGTLIDGTGRPPVPNATVLIEHGRITRVGGSEITAPAGVRMVNAAGQFIVPGFIDAHVHYRDWLGELFLAYGVTSIFDLGNPPDWIFALRDASARGLMRGPRLYIAGPMIDGQNEASGGASGGGGTGFAGSNIARVKTVEEARQTTRALISRGVDFIKVYQQLTLEQLAAVTAEAHQAGLVVIGHTYDAEGSGRAGLNAVTHLWGMSSTCMTPEELKRFRSGEIACPYAYLAGPRRDALIRFLVENHMYAYPQLADEHAALNARVDQFRDNVSQLMGNPDLGYVPDDSRIALSHMFTTVRNYATRFGRFPPLAKLPPDIQQEFRAGYQRAQEFVGAFAAAGGKILAGSDTAGTSVTPGLSLHDEMQLLVDAGLTPMQAIQTATSIPGELVAQRDAVGTVEPGKRGDLVILAANPLADISNTRRIIAVVKDGVPVDTRYRADYSVPIPYPMAEFPYSHVQVPSLTEIDPKSAPVRSGPVTLTVRGAAFYMTSEVTVASRTVPTRFVSPSQLEATIPADLLQAIGTLPVRVVSPRPGGGSTSAWGFVVSP